SERHLEGAAQPERPERQAVMDREGAVEDDAAERAPPILVDPMELAIHDLDGNEAQGVVDEVGRHVGKHDESGSQADPPDHARVTDREYGLRLHLGSFAPTNEYRKSSTSTPQRRPGLQSLTHCSPPRRARSNDGFFAALRESGPWHEAAVRECPPRA